MVKRIAWLTGVLMLLTLATLAPTPAATAADQAACFITPFDAASASFRGAGFGTPQRVVENVTVKAQDHATFVASCASLDSPPTGFTMDVDFWFEEEVSPGNWVPAPGSAFHCSTSSVGVGLTQTATLSVPGLQATLVPACDFRRFYDEDDPTIFRPHRAHIVVTTSMGDELDGTSLSWSLV